MGRGSQVREVVCVAAAASVVVAAVALVVSSALSAYGAGDSGQSGEVSQGRAYLDQLAGQDLVAVRSGVTVFHRQEIIDEVRSGQLSVWSLFQSCVFFGDSRTVGLWYYDLMDASQVVADGGWTIADLREHEDEIAAKNPEYLFLCTGVNDVGIGIWPTPDEYAQAYKEVIDELQEKMPSTHIVVNSIIPVREDAFERGPAWAQIPAYNAALKAMCGQYGISYVDNDQISAENYDDMYSEEGVHFTTPFYEVWGQNMAAALDL